MKTSSYLLLIPSASFLLACAIASGACSGKVGTPATTPSVSVAAPSSPPSDITYAPGASPHEACAGDVYYPDDGGYVACINGVWVWESASWAVPSGYTVDPQLEGAIPPTTPIGVMTPPGVTIGGECEGDVYFTDDDGYIVCEDGAWAYEGARWDIPAGYTIDSEYAGSSDSGFETASESGESVSGIVTPPGVAIGGTCVGDIYFEDDGGYVVCEDGTWAYEDAGWEIPAGYTVDPEYADGFGSS